MSMHHAKSPGAHHSDRGREISLGGLTSHTTPLPHTQRHRMTWKVNRWLIVCEVRHDR
jgi:hypothetical protein